MGIACEAAGAGVYAVEHPPANMGFARVLKLAHVAVGAAGPSVTLFDLTCALAHAAKSWRPRLHLVPYGLAGGFLDQVAGKRFRVCSQYFRNL